MPEMILIRVDLPAPLSPTRAVTSPAGAAKSTSLSACTAPNRLFTPRSSSRGVLATSWPPSGFRRYGPDPDKRPARTSVRRPGWRLGHGDRREDDGGHVLLAVVGLLGGHAAGSGGVAVDQVDRELRGVLGLRLDRLVDGHVLLAGEDSLDSGQLVVLD